MPDQSILIVVAVILAGILVFGRRLYADRLGQKEKTIQNLSSRVSDLQQRSFEEKNELRAILSSMVEGVMVIGRDEKILYVSPNISGMFQMRSNDVALKPYWEAIAHQQINDSISGVMESQKAVNKEIILINAP